MEFCVYCRDEYETFWLKGSAIYKKKFSAIQGVYMEFLFEGVCYLLTVYHSLGVPKVTRPSPRYSDGRL